MNGQRDVSSSFQQKQDPVLDHAFHSKIESCVPFIVFHVNDLIFTGVKNKLEAAV
jgi:hypothetical protein